MKPYSPINCGDYDYLEIACMDHYELDLYLVGAEATAIRGTAKRLETRSGEEHLWISDENGQEGSFRIDTIERIVVVTRPARFTEHQFGA